MVKSDGYHDPSTDLAIHCVVFPSLPSQIVNPLFFPVLHSQVVSNIAIVFNYNRQLSRVASIAKACQPGWEETENLRGKLRKLERK